MPHSTSYADALNNLRRELASIYDEAEATAIAREVMWECTGLSRADSVSQSTGLLEKKDQYEKLGLITANLLAGMPMQYAIGHTSFYRRKFFVNNSVLIPRPETEELVEWILKDHGSQKALRFLDVGTGSGCIGVSLSLGLPESTATAIDISREALVVAEQNAVANDATIAFRALDFLAESDREKLGTYDLIVSNPPYIPASGQHSLDANVRDWEPHQALFVADNDPVVFYRAIALFGLTHLKKGGDIYCELHADFAAESAALFKEGGYANVEVKKDMSGNQRMLRARW